MASELAQHAEAELGALETRLFPDGESYVRIDCDVASKDVDFVCTLANPDAQFLRLIYAANTARELGAKRVGLIAPYLAYMRQDKRFMDGESISSRHFAKLLSETFDNLVTVDPHLHRVKDLAEIFTIPTRVERAAPLLAAWIRKNVGQAVIVGPDAESEQWASDVAMRANAPYVVLSKKRFGGRKVEVTVPVIDLCRGRQPILVDDVVSSGHTMIEAAQEFGEKGFRKPYCMTVHPLFAGDSYGQLLEHSERIISTDTISHESSIISIAELLV
jgi:ribose-phosphate pyrophosphokinase